MDYNGKLLARARERLARLREENAAEQRRRTAEAYARLPRLRELDRELRTQMIELARLAMDRSAAAKERLASLRDENLALQAERAELLVSAGFPADYTDEIYSCPDCHDTGIKGTGICHCLKILYKRELTDENLASLAQHTLFTGGQTAVLIAAPQVTDYLSDLVNIARTQSFLVGLVAAGPVAGLFHIGLTQNGEDL